MPNFSFRGLTAVLSLTCIALSAPAHADLQKIRQGGILKVAVYNEFAPFSNKNAGIDIDFAEVLAKKLGLKLSLLPFNAGENLSDDLRNMVWKGHYLGYGPADVLLHVPVDRRLMEDNDKVEIFSPYHVETVRLVSNKKTVPNFEGLNSLLGKKIGVEKISISAVVMLGEENGKYRDNVRIFPTAIEALEKLKAGELDAVLANRSEIESVLKDDPNFALNTVQFQRLPRQGWAVGMAVKKDQVELAKLLQATTNDMVASGELANIFMKHGVHIVKP